MNDRVLGIAALLLAGFMFWQSYDMVPDFSYEPLGPRAFPMLLSVMIAFCGLYLVIKGQFQAHPVANDVKLRIILLALVILIYALLFQPLGFILATFLAVMAIGFLFGGKLLPLSITSLLTAVILYVLFDRVLEVVLPVGILGHWL